MAGRFCGEQIRSFLTDSVWDSAARFYARFYKLGFKLHISLTPLQCQALFVAHLSLI